MQKERGTVQETLDFIVNLLDEAADVLPWAMSAAENREWEGRLTKASAMGLKARILLFAASPLFNSSEPYMPGEAADKRLMWFGSYKPELWTQALAAHKAFFDELNKNGQYGLVYKSDPDKRFVPVILIGVQEKQSLLHIMVIPYLIIGLGDGAIMKQPVMPVLPVGHRNLLICFQ